MVLKEFKVIELHASFGEGVVVVLTPMFPIATQVPLPERVIAGPAPKTEEEKMAQGMVRAVMDEFRRAGAPLPTPQDLASMMPRTLLPLTKEEYEELKPMIGQVITVTLNIKGEPNV